MKNNFVPWNKGLTKKTDHRILYGKAQTEAAHKAIRKKSIEKFNTNPTTRVSSLGYKMISIPGGWEIGYHIYVWEKVNEKVLKGKCIHHIDGNKLNNNITNLLCTGE